ncbi:hypothetical protein D0Z00_003885 [Geotrichum galactomycetum]|uniref:Uncharacterized protein n=1 Tax=Geotrichum galactomycetum TaxID=27317 RepID=A0ACB6V021_9ASCO|nr:hypothetical protein D0Z00_003885 [Geotrichum candidum]
MIGKGDLSLTSLGFAPELEESTDLSPTNNGINSRTDGLITTEPGQNLSMEMALDLPTPELIEPADDVASIISMGNGEQPKIKSRPSFDSWGRSSRLLGKRTMEKSMTMPPITSPTLPRVSSKASLDSATASSGDLSGSDDNKPKNEEAKLGSFAFAPAKRNIEFHKLFRSLHINDGLVDDFSCALSKEILIQGRLYISERSICFNSNILGWVTNLIISFNEIVGVEKKTTAGLFPNGIIIQTLHGRHTFASFISRDTVYDMIIEIWKRTNGRSKSGTDFDAAPSIKDVSDMEDAAESIIADDDSDLFSSEYDVSDEEESDEFDQLEEDDVSSDEEFGETMQPKKKEPSATPAAVEEERDSNAATAPAPSEGGQTGAWPVANLGPDTHAPTDAGFDADALGEKQLINDTIPAPPGVVANLIFGDDTKWISKFITEKEKNIDLKPMTGFDGGFAAGNKREFEYVKPLSGPVGPKQTRCQCTESIEFWDLTDHVTVVTTTRTPDVPSGGSFSTKTRYNLAWADGNATSLIISYMVEWTAKSWFKGPIEKGTHDGQTAFAQNLLSELTATVKGGAGAGRAAGKKKVGETKKKAKRSSKAKAAAGKKGAKKELQKSNISEPGVEAWIEKVSSFLVSKPLGDAVPIPAWMIILLVFVVYWLLSRLFFGGSGATVGVHRHITDSHLASELERIRLEQEYDMWQWVTDRTGPSGGNGRHPVFSSVGTGAHKLKRTLKHESELKEAIKLTELRIKELKLALNL